jgi:hypothetical protein
VDREDQFLHQLAEINRNLDRIAAVLTQLLYLAVEEMREEEQNRDN